MSGYDFYFCVGRTIPRQEKNKFDTAFNLHYLYRKLLSSERMLIIICLMVGGIVLGRLTQVGHPGMIRKGIFGAILILLFLLGLAVGHNRQIMDNLGTIGVDALLITLGAVGGSLVCAWAVYKFYFSKPE